MAQNPKQIKISESLFQDIFTYFQYWEGVPMTKERMCMLRDRIRKGLKQKLMAQARRTAYMDKCLKHD